MMLIISSLGYCTFVVVGLNKWFCLYVGESGSDIVANSDEHGWHREAEHCFTMWCSGRQCCEGMLLTLKLIKVQRAPSSSITTCERIRLGKYYPSNG